MRKMILALMVLVFSVGVNGIRDLEIINGKTAYAIKNNRYTNFVYYDGTSFSPVRIEEVSGGMSGSYKTFYFNGESYQPNSSIEDLLRKLSSSGNNNYAFARKNGADFFITKVEDKGEFDYIVIYKLGSAPNGTDEQLAPSIRPLCE